MRLRLPVAAALAALLLGAAGAPPAAQPIARTQLGWWQARHLAKLAELKANAPDLLLLGDSITQDYELTGPEPFRDFRAVWQRFYGGRRVANLGFSGDATSHLLWRIEHGEIDGIAPRATVILIGANNLGRLHWSADDTVAGIAAIIADVHRRLPATSIVLLSVLPSDRGEWVARTGAEINAALATRYGGHALGYVTFRDVARLFMAEGRVNTTLYFDPRLTPPNDALHPAPEGMALMAAAIEPDISRLLGDQQRQ